LKRIISLICLTFLIVTLAAPTQFIASAAGEQIIFGEDALEIDGVPYIKSSVDIKGPFDFEDGNGTVSDFDDGSENYVRGKRIGDFSELTGLEDTEGHGEVFVYDSGYIKLNETDIRNGCAVINFDMYYPNGMNSSALQFWSPVFAGGTNKTPNSQLMKFGNGGIWYDGKRIREIPTAEWVNFGLVIDIEARTYTFVIDGEFVETVDSQLDAASFYRVYTIKAQLFPAEGSEMYIDNFAVYKYLPSYSATVKGVNEDGELIDTLNFEKGSKFAVEFSASMNTEYFDGNVLLRRKDGDNVELVDITAADYDVDTKTLYVTIDEDLEPKSEYEIVLKANTVDENDNTIYGVCTSGNVSPIEDTVIEISSGAPVYGVEEIALGGYTIDTLPAGETVEATVNLRTESAHDANLVLALYADGKLCSLSSAVITAEDISAEQPMNISVPDNADEAELSVVALLLGSNYEVIDVISID